MEIKCYQQGRCPICTLQPPCNHVKEALLPKSTSLMNKQRGSPFKAQNNSPSESQQRDSIDSLYEPSAWTDDASPSNTPDNIKLV